MNKPTPAFPTIDELHAYVPGKSGGDDTIKLSANENPLGASPQVAEALKQVTLLAPHRYPDGGCTALREAIAALHQIDANRIVCGTGSGDLLQTLVGGYATVGDDVLYSEHGFLLYPISAARVGSNAIAVPEKDCCADVDALLAAQTESTKLVLIANPNNPTGSYLPKDALIRLREGLRNDVILVVDDAYAEYATADDYVSALTLVDDYPNIVCTRTFSKAYGLGGLRIGWTYASAEITETLNKIRAPFNVDSFAQAAAIAALNDQNHIRLSVEHNTQAREFVASALKAHGYTVYPSEANFVLVDCGDESKAEALDAHLRANGIYVRQVGAYALPTCLRITIGTDDENSKLLEFVAAFSG